MAAQDGPGQPRARLIVPSGARARVAEAVTGRHSQVAWFLLVTTLPKVGTASEQQVEDWLQQLGKRRPENDVALLRQAVAMARASHRGEPAPMASIVLSLLHRRHTDSLKRRVYCWRRCCPEMPGHPT